VPTTGTASAATGVISMTLLTAVVVLGVLVNRQGRLPGLPRFAGLSLHRYLALLAVGFLTLHILTALAVPFADIGLAATVIPFTSAREPVWLGLGAVSFDLVIALVVTSLLRRHLGRRTWRAVHWLAYVCWPAALAHSVGTGPGMRSGRLLDLAIACAAAVAAAVGWRLTGTWRGGSRARRPDREAMAAEWIPEPKPERIRTPEPESERILEPEPEWIRTPEPERMPTPEPELEPEPEQIPAPESPAAGTKLLRVNPIACSGHGLCAELLPELIALDRWGYPMVSDQPVPARLARRAARAVTDCPALALLLGDARDGQADPRAGTPVD
jgi:methionine sulfoxide reductase heme-binding subunit